MSIDLTRFYDSFFSEAFDLIAEAESLFLAIERGDTSPDTLDAAFRCVHSIKGSAGSLGFDSIAEFSHEFESAMDALRGGAIRADRQTMDLLLAALDTLRIMLDSAKLDEPGIDPARISAVSQRLRQLTRAPTGAEGSTAGVTQVQSPNAAAGAASAAGAANQFTIRFRPLRAAIDQGHDPIRYLIALEQLGDARFTPLADEIPDCARFDPDQAYLAWRIELSTTKSRADLIELFEWIEDFCELSIAAANSVAATVREVRIEAAPAGGATSIHVKADRLNQLMNLLGEMLIAQSRVRALCGSQAGDTGEQLRLQLAALDRNTAALQEVILSIRLIPVAALFARFERLVRDAAQSLGKSVELICDSQGAELDNGLIERLLDPLTHLIRNAIDHGVETSAERLAIGKPAVARLILSAQLRAGRVVIEVRDDGRGIAVERVKQRAIERGLAQADELKSDQEWIRYIFQPGFSTAEAVSAWSGRGVGLDAALSAVHSIGGQLTVSSEIGQGSCFRVSLPLTTSILEGLVVECAGRPFVVPLSAVSRCIGVMATAIKTLPGGAQAYELDGQYLPFARLADLLGEPAQPAIDTFAAASSVALLVQTDEQPMVLLVDAIASQAEVVVKSIRHHAFRSPLAIGATILDDGEIALILDLAAVHSAFSALSRLPQTADSPELSYV